PSRERRGRSPTKPNSDLIKQLLSQQQIGTNPQVTKQARRIYVGNMPLASTYSESALISFFTNAATNCGITTPHPVVSVWTSSDGSFCVSYNFDCALLYFTFRSFTFAFELFVCSSVSF
ncbi:hypothetical protein BVRB_024840, partial [Beta vulgaris subsp. vulgaris]